MWPWISLVIVLPYFFKISVEKNLSSVRKGNSSADTILMCWVRYLITSLKTYLTCTHCTLAVLILSFRLAIESANVRLSAVQEPLYDKERLKGSCEAWFWPPFWCKQVPRCFQDYKTLAYTLAAGFLLRPSLRLWLPPSPTVYPHGIKLVAFKEGSVHPCSTGFCIRANINVPKTA